MKDARAILLKGFIGAYPSINGVPVLTRVPKTVEYPYIHVSDIYQTEVGSKTEYQYQLDVLFNVVYKDVKSLVPLYEIMDALMEIINNAKPEIELEIPYKIDLCTLNNSTTTEVQQETGTLSVGLVRINFLIS